MLLLMQAGGIASSAVSRLSPEQVQEFLGFTRSDWKRLQRGEVVVKDVEASSDERVAVAAGVRLPEPVERTARIFESGTDFSMNPAVIEQGTFGPGVNLEEAFERAVFTRQEVSKAGELYRARPGTSFNMSREEFTRFSALRERFEADSCERIPACTEAVSREFREVLIGRARSYLEAGISGVDPYARENEDVWPAYELRQAAERMKHLSNIYPGVYDAYVNYPADPYLDADHRFYWVKWMIRDEVTFVLVHRMFWKLDGLVLGVERQFYVSEGYNTMQATYGLFPEGDTTLLFYLNRATSDRLSGFGGWFRKDSGRRFMGGEVRKHFEETLGEIRED